MKVHKARFDLIISLGLLLLIICFSFILFFPVALLNAFYIHWLLLLFCLLFFLSSRGKISLSTDNQPPLHVSSIPWFIRIWLFQLCLFIVFLAICELIGYLLPIQNNIAPFLFRQSNIQMIWHLGLFPWAAICLVAISMSLVSYRYQEDAFMHRILNSLIKSGPRDAFGLVVNNSAKLATLLAFSSTFVLISLILAFLLSPVTVPIALGFHPSTLIIIALLALFSFLKPFKIFLKHLFSRKIPVTLSIIVLNILLAVLILLLSWLFQRFNQFNIAVPWLVRLFEKTGSDKLRLIFVYAWWIGWTPISAAYLAHMSQGYQIRQLILAGLSFPILFGIFISLDHTLTHHIPGHHPIFICVLGLVAFIGLIYLLTQKNMLSSLILSILPKAGPIKIRHHAFFFRKCVQIALLILYFYLPIGIVGIAVIALIMTLPFSLVILLITLTLLKWFFDKKMQFK